MSLGANLGDRRLALEQAVSVLKEFVIDIRSARFYETLPRYMEDQPRFLNTVVTGIVSDTPEGLLARIHALEVSLGRNRANYIRMGPRSIDIDILLYGDIRLHTETLVIPHPRICERKFVLIPLLELAPALREPGTGIPYADYLSTLEAQGIYYHSLAMYTFYPHGRRPDPNETEF